MRLVRTCGRVRPNARRGFVLKSTIPSVNAGAHDDRFAFGPSKPRGHVSEGRDAKGALLWSATVVAPGGERREVAEAHAHDWSRSKMAQTRTKSNSGKRALSAYMTTGCDADVQVPNHGRVFKATLAALLPDWEQRQAKLHSR